MVEQNHEQRRHPSARFARRALIILLASLSLFVVVVALAARPGDTAVHPPGAETDAVRVHIVRNWLHANIVLRRETLIAASSGPAAEALDRLPPGDWITIGWGEADHYRGRGDSPARRLSLARSLLVPDNPAVLLMESGRDPPTPETTGRAVLALDLSPEGFRRLVARLDASFAVSGEGAPVVAGRGRQPQSLFFRATETADLFFACNHWIAELLDAAGAPTNPFLSTMSAGLAWDLKSRAGAVDARGETGDPPDLGVETPPAHAGRFRPASDAAHAVGTARFDGYDLTLGDQHVATQPVRLEQASAAAAETRSSWAQVMDVPPDSLVEKRTLSGDVALCDGAPATGVVIGFRLTQRDRYRLVLAPLADEQVCEVLVYDQP